MLMRLFISFITLLLVISCSTEKPAVIKKNESLFKSYKGTARIVSITPVKDSVDTEDSSYMQLFFDFSPADPGAKNNYQFPEAADSNILLKYDNRNSFHKNWILKWGLKPGNEYPAVRYENSGKVTGAHVYYDVELYPFK